METVKYIGRHERYRGMLYGVNIDIKNGETQSFPEEIIEKLLRHKDSFVKSSDKDSGVIVSPAKQDDVDPTQEIRDTLNTMAAKDLINYAKINYRIALDARKNVQNLRNEVTRLIDQYGVV